MPTITVSASQVSQPVAVGAGSIVTVTPSSGATATVEYTSGSAADVANGVAVWKAWAKGAASAATKDFCVDSVFMRVTASGGPVALDVNSAPSAADVAAFTSDWGGAAPSVKASRRVPYGARQWAALAGFQTGFGAYSWSQLMAIPAPFEAVRIGFGSHASGSYTITNCIAAPTTVLDDTHIPSGGAFATVTFDGSPSITIPASTSQNKAYWSDWISLEALSRTDGGVNPLLLVRVYGAGANMNTFNHGASPGNWTSEAGSSNLPVRFAFKAGDFVSTNQAGFTSLGNPQTGPVFAVQYSSFTPGVTIASIGDSIDEGIKVDPIGMGWVVKAAQSIAAATGVQVSHMNMGWLGQQPDQYLARWLNYIASTDCLPNIGVYAAYSRNGGPMSLAKLKGNLSVFIASCRAKNIVPVIRTGISESASPANNSTMAAMNAATRTICASLGVALIDMEPVLSINGDPAQPNAAYLDADGIHPNTAGNNAMAAKAVSVLQPMIAAWE